MPPIDDTVQFGAGVSVSHRPQVIEAIWQDNRWPPAVASPQVTIAIAPQQIRITVPAVWRAHVHLGWRAGRLLISSDLRTLATALATAKPAPEGIAAFLAHGSRAGPGVLPALWRGVWTIQPGHTATVEHAGVPSCQRTWMPERDEGFAAQPLKVAVGRLREHLDSLAERILARHELVACLFSGGLDSSLVAATLLRRAPNRVVLFNVGSELGTAAEATLRAWCLHDFGAVSNPVDLPSHAGLVRSLRATNAVSDLPTGSLFAHVFEQIIAAARERGCATIVTGDGGDEVFAEREEVLVDLLANRSRSLPPAVGYFALRNGERGTRTLRRALRELRALTGPAARLSRVPAPGDVLLGDELTQQVIAARLAAADQVRRLWQAGWTCSGIGSYQRAAAVPEWEPVSSTAPDFPVISPLVDEAIVADALAPCRDALIPQVCGGQPKWLLRQAALHWLSPRIALHPKIGSADGQILARVRADEHRELLELLTSGTALRAGLRVPSAVEDPGATLWFSDAWIRAAALVAWLDATGSPPSGRPVVTVAAAKPAPPPSSASTAPHRECARGTRWHVVLLVALNLAAQVTPTKAAGASRSVARFPNSPAPDTGLRDYLVDLARRACAVPFVSGSSRVMSHALSWHLRLRGRRAVLIRGTAQGERRTRYWVEIGGAIVDVGGAQTPLVPDPER